MVICLIEYPDYNNCICSSPTMYTNHNAHVCSHRYQQRHTATGIAFVTSLNAYMYQVYRQAYSCTKRLGVLSAISAIVFQTLLIHYSNFQFRDKDWLCHTILSSPNRPLPTDISHVLRDLAPTLTRKVEGLTWPMRGGGTRAPGPTGGGGGRNGGTPPPGKVWGSWAISERGPPASLSTEAPWRIKAVIILFQTPTKDN